MMISDLCWASQPREYPPSVGYKTLSFTGYEDLIWMIWQDIPNWKMCVAGEKHSFQYPCHNHKLGIFLLGTKTQDTQDTQYPQDTLSLGRSKESPWPGV